MAKHPEGDTEAPYQHMSSIVEPTITTSQIPRALRAPLLGAHDGDHDELDGAAAAPAPIIHRIRSPSSPGQTRHNISRHLSDSTTDSTDQAPPPDSGIVQSQPRIEEPSAPTPPAPSDLLSKLSIYSYLIIFSILGTLARLGLSWLTFYPGAPVVTPTLWANFAGSLLIGFLSQDKSLFRQPEELPAASSSVEPRQNKILKSRSAKLKQTMPLYIGLATGFCGSLTSFSSFQRDVFLALSNSLPSPYYHVAPTTGDLSSDFSMTTNRNGGYSVLALLAVIISTVGLSLCAIRIGAHLALALERFTPTLPTALTRRFLDKLVLVLGPGCWIGAVIMCISPPDRPPSGSSNSRANELWRGEVLFALVFAPPGCLLRYFTSIRLNPIARRFPLGTFSVNIFGCAVSGMCYDLQHVGLGSSSAAVGGGRVACQVLPGVMDGFCGALTTVSTFALELTSLAKSKNRGSLRSAWVYGTVSVVVGACVMILIMGSVLWTVGWTSPACVTMRTDL